MCPKTEALLFAAARSDHLDTLIKPAIADGKIVISDRFTDSTSAYQGYGRGLHDVVSTLEKLVCDIFEPDYTLFFNITLEESIKRLTARNTDINHFDTEETAFKERVHAGYLARLRVKSHRMVEIDAMQSIGDVEKQIEKWVDEVFVPNNPLAKE
jgi:dTMP kinase